MRSAARRITQHAPAGALRTILYLSASNGVNAVLGLLYLTVATRVVPVADLGEAMATISLMAFLASVGNLGLGVGLARFRHSYEADYGRLVATVFAVTLSAGALISVGLIVVLGQGQADRFALPPVLLSIGVLVTLVCGVLDALAIADRDSGKVLIRNLVVNVSRLLLLFVVVDAADMVLTTLIALGASAVIVLPFRRELRARPRLVRLPPELLAFSLKQHAVTWAFNAPNYLLPIIVYLVIGAEAAGYFAVAWSVAYLLCAVGDAAAMAVLTEGVVERADARRIAVTVLGYVGVPLVAAVAFAVWAAPAFGYVVAEEFADGMLPYFRILAPAAIPYLLVTVAIGVLRIRMDSVRALTLAAVSGLGACAGAVALQPVAGVMAPAWAWVVSNLVAAAIAVTLPARVGEHQAS